MGAIKSFGVFVLSKPAKDGRRLPRILAVLIAARDKQSLITSLVNTGGEIVIALFIDGVPTFAHVLIPIVDVGQPRAEPAQTERGENSERGANETGHGRGLCLLNAMKKRTKPKAMEPKIR